MIFIAVFYAAVSVLAYSIYAIDKRAAMKHRRRVSEQSLHLLGVLGGWPGALLAQQHLRHKTRKTAFQLIFWLTVALNLACVGWLMSWLEIV
ncbi:hypothetical protein HVA01_10990 [Halovibrio variabilis]|uniref:Cold-shock protein n=1 Tax=Halovibrio variabilis TaxID=31910 RepID=A0A511UPN6_9GAMM|nr:DUF1294 domain-containing protein [Halovibrio variabilis]GEN27453.1 hypothetical protein HVA01_10990 [Halovibrio variabilis]